MINKVDRYELVCDGCQRCEGSYDSGAEAMEQCDVPSLAAEWYCVACTAAKRVGDATASDLDAAALALLAAKGAFNRLYIRHWADVKPCKDTQGFAILERFRGHVDVFVMKYDRKAEGLKQACEELFRLIRVEQAAYTLADAFGFVKWYGDCKRRLAKALDEVIKDRGDDGFGDLCDLLLLLGKKLVSNALKGAYADEQSIRAAANHEHGGQWSKFVFDGENYVRSTLERAACDAFLVDVRRRLDPDGTATEYSTHFDE